MKRVYTTQESNIFNNQEIYQIEIEVDNNEIGAGTKHKSPKLILESLRKVIKFVLGWDIYGCLQALEPLGSLCPIKDGKVCFFHKSVWDWLVDPTLSGAPWHVSANSGHHRIADLLDKNIQRCGYFATNKKWLTQKSQFLLRLTITRNRIS